MYNPNISTLEGMSSKQLKEALVKAQKTYVDLMTGNRGIKFSYGQGNGLRTVKYEKLDPESLEQFIEILKKQLELITDEDE